MLSINNVLHKSDQGKWSGTIAALPISRDIDGEGPQTVPFEWDADITEITVRKEDDSSDELAVELYLNGLIIQESSTTASYGGVTVSYSGY